MAKRLTEKAANWVEEAVAVHQALVSRLGATTERTTSHAEHTGSIAQAAATITAAIITRAGATGPYDLIEDDPEATAREDELRRAEHARIEPNPAI